MYDIITIGDIKLDTFIVLPETSIQCSLRHNECQLCLEYGKKIPVESFEPQIAGSAANVAVGCSRLGLRAAIYSIMGDDETTDLAFKKLGREGVDTRYIRVKKGTLSSFSIVLIYRGERTILANHGSEEYVLPKINQTQWLYLSELGSGYEALFKRLPDYIRAQKTKLAFNPGTLQIKAGAKALAPVLKVTEVLLVNLEEAHALLGEKNGQPLERLIKMLWKHGPAIVVITDGARGAYAFDGGDIIHTPARPVRPVETTGAGDSLGTAVVSALYYGKTLREALVWGMTNAASVIMKVGPQPGLLTKNGMERALKKK